MVALTNPYFLQSHDRNDLDPVHGLGIRVADSNTIMMKAAPSQSHQVFQTKSRKNRIF